MYLSLWLAPIYSVAKAGLEFLIFLTSARNTGMPPPYLAF